MYAYIFEVTPVIFSCQHFYVTYCRFHACYNPRR